MVPRRLHVCALLLSAVRCSLCIGPSPLCPVSCFVPAGPVSGFPARFACPYLRRLRRPVLLFRLGLAISLPLSASSVVGLETFFYRKSGKVKTKMPGGGATRHHCGKASKSMSSIVRGVSTRTLLRGAGNLLRSSEGNDDTYRLSRPVERLDAFLSDLL